MFQYCMPFFELIYFQYFPTTFLNNFESLVFHLQVSNFAAEAHSMQMLFTYFILFYICWMESLNCYDYHSNFMSIFLLFPIFLIQIEKSFCLIVLVPPMHHLRIYLIVFKFHLSFVMFTFTFLLIFISNFPYSLLYFLKFHIYFQYQKFYHSLDFFNS